MLKERDYQSLDSLIIRPKDEMYIFMNKKL